VKQRVKIKTRKCIRKEKIKTRKYTRNEKIKKGNIYKEKEKELRKKSIRNV
jgi:hypothetical protein